MWSAECGIARRVIPRSAFRIPNLRKAGRYKLAAPVSKTGSVRTEVGALPTPSATFTIKPGDPYDHSPIPTAMAAEQVAETRAPETDNRKEERPTSPADAAERKASTHQYGGSSTPGTSTPRADVTVKAFRPVAQ